MVVYRFPKIRRIRRFEGTKNRWTSRGKVWKMAHHRVYRSRSRKRERERERERDRWTENSFGLEKARRNADRWRSGGCPRNRLPATRLTRWLSVRGDVSFRSEKSAFSPVVYMDPLYGNAVFMRWQSPALPNQGKYANPFVVKDWISFRVSRKGATSMSDTGRVRVRDGDNLSTLERPTTRRPFDESLPSSICINPASTPAADGPFDFHPSATAPCLRDRTRGFHLPLFLTLSLSLSLSLCVVSSFALCRRSRTSKLRSGVALLKLGN